MRVPGCVFAVAAVLAAGPAAANPVKSLYTTVELKSCKPLKRHKDGDAWRCEGLPGYPVYVAAGDLRQFVSAGKNAEYRRAATQTLGPFNTIFENGHQRATIEWRFALRAGVQIPYATIVRYHTSRQGRSGDVAAFLRCHLGDHQDVADEQARTFDCRQEPRAMGERGKSPM